MLLLLLPQNPAYKITERIRPSQNSIFLGVPNSTSRLFQLIFFIFFRENCIF